jgi:ssDNA-binding Zn-finger/Zn-ribbon topoisomerase 1
MKTKNLNARQPGLKEDWLADNAAFECPVCGKVYLVSGSINPVRTCPNCGQSHGHITGSRQGGGKAFVVWDHFVLGQTYSRAKIRRVLGGNEMDCLPHEHGLVICGCFNRRRHPEAPDIITVGDSYLVQTGARLFCAQKQPIPVFIRRDDKAWEYVGHYRAERFTTKRKEMAAHHKGSITPLNELTRVIFLKRA